MVRGIYDVVFRHVNPNHSYPSVKFDSHRSRENEFITLFICYMTLYNHAIDKLCDFVDNRPVLELTSLSSLVAIRLAEVEI